MITLKLTLQRMASSLQENKIKKGESSCFHPIIKLEINANLPHDSVHHLAIQQPKGK